VPVATLEGRPLVEALKALATDSEQRPVLILTDDRAVDTVSVHRDELAPMYRIQLPPEAVVPVLADKTHFQQFAEKVGLPVPRSVVVRHPSDLGQLTSLTPPLILKPANKALVLSGRIERAVRVDTIDEARAAVSRMLERAQSLIVQEWIDGQDTDIFFSFFVCDVQSRLMALFHGRKVVCAPPHIGNTALCAEAHDVTGELERLTRQFIAAAGYVGIGGIEFKRDQRTGRFVIVEPTVGRTDWQEEIATLCGVNVPLIAYFTALDQPVEALRREWRPFAWRSSRSYRAPAGQLAEGVRVVDGHFRITDPIPGIYYYGFERFAVRLWNLATQPGRFIERAARFWRSERDE
jgi:predicted ATP-grasp superfamily ATP-dependent carboligase